MLQFLRHKSLVCAFSLMLPSITMATTDECQSALDTALNSVTSSRNTQSQTMSNSSPGLYDANAANSMAQAIQRLMQQINEDERKLIELTKQEMEQYYQTDSEQFKQIEQLRDLERQNAKEREQLPIERNNAAFELKKAQEDIRNKCEAKAEQEYTALTARNAEAVSGSRYTTSSLSQARGTQSRMRSQRRLYYDRCIADPTTQSAFSMAQEAFQLAMRNMQVKTDSLLADLEHIRSKYTSLDTHMTEKRRHIAEMAAIERAAIEQAIQNNRTQMIFASLSSAMQTQNTQTAAAQFNGADQIIAQFESIRTICSNETSNQFTQVPSDVFSYFSIVNRSCRGGSTTNTCVRSSGQTSSTTNSTAQ